MDKKRHFKRTAIIIASFVAVLGVAIGGTYAFLQSRSNNLTNKFEIGSVETEITEEKFEFASATLINKDPRVKNVGKNDCYIRARINITPEGEGITLGSINPKWVKDGEYYYYTDPVAPNDSTEPIFTTVTIPEGWVTYSDGVAKATDKFKDFDVIVYQEAVVANLAGYENYGTIWEAYNSYTP